jgi:hypothetical protein
VVETTIDNPGPQANVVETYRDWVETLAGYMERAAGLLENLYAQQDEVIEQLRQLCARTNSLRHADFDVIFGKVLADRRKTRESLSALVDGYRAGRDAVIQEVRKVLTADAAQAVGTWPTLKQKLLSEKDDGVGDIVAVLRQVHVEQEQIAMALSGLLRRGERLKINDLKTVAERLASRDSRDSAELAALLAVCESAGRNAGRRWQRLAGGLPESDNSAVTHEGDTNV